MSYIVYRHVRLDINQPFYIGIGKVSNTYNRTLDKRRNPIWKNIVAKNNGQYRIDILFNNLTLEEAIEKEKEFINLYGKILNQSGTLANILDQGSGMIKGYMSDVVKEKLRIKMKGNSYAKGAVWSEESKIKMSLQRRGIKNNLGKTWSDETKLKMSKSHLGNTATKGYIKINNGFINKMIPKSTDIPEGWVKGQLSHKKLKDLEINNV
jgi:hypothetical protein